MVNNQSSSYIEQSAVIPYRFREGNLEVLLITSRNNKRWIVPKGIIDPGMTPQQAASQEAFEEAGVKGKVFDNLMGTYTYEKWGGVCRVRIFLLEVESIYIDWLEASFRKRQWVSLDQAINLIQEEEVRNILANLPDYFKQI